MNKQETSRLIHSLRSLGWSDKEINALFLYLGTGDEQYKPKPNKD